MAKHHVETTAPIRAWLDAALVTVNGECCITLPVSLIPFITGALAEYRLPDMWYGDDTDIIYANKVFETVIAELSAVISSCSSNQQGGSLGGFQAMANSGCNPCAPIRFEDGVLQWYNGCEWVNVSGKAGETSGKDVIPDIEPETPELQSDLRCVKANVIGDLIWKVSEAIRDVIDNVMPQNFIHEVEIRAGIQLDTPGMLGAWATYWAHTLLLSDFLNAELDDTKQSEFICQYSKVADGSTTSISDKEMDRIHAVMAQTLGIDVIATGFFENIILAIGKARLEQAVRMAVSAGKTYECPCLSPEEEIPSLYDWKFVYDFKRGPYNFTTWSPYANGMGNRWELGNGWVSYPEGQQGFPVQIRAAAPYAVVQGDPECHVTYVKVYYSEWGATNADFDKQWVNIFSQGSIHGAALQQLPAHVWQGETDDIYTSYLTLNGANDWWNGNTGRRFVVDKIVIAGTGKDRFTGCQPDGTLL